MSAYSIAALLVAAIVILSSHQAQAAIARADFSNAAHPGKCVLSQNSVMSPGESGKAPNHPCAGITCLGDGRVQFRTCQAVAPPKGCKLRDFVDTNRNYPECCERTYDCSKHI
ncbi:CG2444 [Drosophila busckii]|uniref:CG2444 n=1 Tax=Drosophila busckii TaxID=30019 RepID=A0A0M4F9R4_DROBS|nr:uncharacterized protein LOC108605237 [Drosophila busckii]ALC49020.1 CG2444 [Drosophila busckii]